MSITRKMNVDEEDEKMDIVLADILMIMVTTYKYKNVKRKKPFFTMGFRFFHSNNGNSHPLENV